MAQSSDPGKFFQTTSFLEESERKASKSYNVLGDPIKLPSKLLAIIPDPLDEDAVYVAESAGTVKRVTLSDKNVTHTFIGPAAPVSCISIYAQRVGDQVHQKIFGGCWDKNIWVWDLPTAQGASATVKSHSQLRGHVDFVKALTILSPPGLSEPLLISGGAESEILFWNIQNGERLSVLKGHLRGILDLQFDPSTLQPGTEEAVLYSATSNREIHATCIPIPAAGNSISSSTLKSLVLSKPLLVHETSVYHLHFDEDGSGLWTASADKTAKHLSRKETDGQLTMDNLAKSWESDTTFTHPDFVRAVVSHSTLPLVVTGCRDEEVRLFNANTGKLEHTYSGHYEEVTGLCVRGTKVISVSIDGTIRSWSLKASDIEESKKEMEKLKSGTETNEDAVRDPAAGQSMMTEEEERELAELMEED